MEGSVIAARSNDLRGARKAPCVRFGGWSGRSGAAADGGLRIARVPMRPIIREFRCPPDRLIAGWQCRDACRTGLRMGDLDRLVPSGIIEQWVYHLRRQRARAADAIWLIDQGFTLHDGHGGLPQHDATARWRTEQEAVVEEVTALLALYDGINLGKTEADLSPDQR